MWGIGVRKKKERRKYEHEQQQLDASMLDYAYTNMTDN